MRWAALALLCVVALVTVAATAGNDSSPSPKAKLAPHVYPPVSKPGLWVSGNRLMSGNRPIRLIGVNRSGTEYACVQGWGIFDGPSDARSVRAMASWQINEVRIPINEDCWLGINGIKAVYGGARYRAAIVNYVQLLHRHGIYAELSLMWAAPGRNLATYQAGGPDATHAPAAWASLARTFRGNPDVVLAPWGETVVDANCFLHGGVCEATFGPHNAPYRIAGMQQAVDVIRGAGYTGVIAIPGVSYANDLTHWLSREPQDPLHQLIAEAHVYGKNTCWTPSCLQAAMAPVASRVPLLLGEMGESFDASDCGSSRVSQIIGWADAHDVSYSAWAWDTWGNCEALIRSYSGRPAHAYGAWIKAHYAKVGPSQRHGVG